MAAPHSAAPLSMASAAQVAEDPAMELRNRMSRLRAAAARHNQAKTESIAAAAAAKQKQQREQHTVSSAQLQAQINMAVPRRGSSTQARRVEEDVPLLNGSPASEGWGPSYNGSVSSMQGHSMLATLSTPHANQTSDPEAITERSRSSNATEPVAHLDPTGQSGLTSNPFLNIDAPRSLMERDGDHRQMRPAHDAAISPNVGDRVSCQQPSAHMSQSSASMHLKESGNLNHGTPFNKGLRAFSRASADGSHANHDSAQLSDGRRAPQFSDALRCGTPEMALHNHERQSSSLPCVMTPTSIQSQNSPDVHPILQHLTRDTLKQKVSVFPASADAFWGPRAATAQAQDTSAPQETRPPLTHSAETKLKHIFTKLDLNNNGRLNKRELIRSFRIDQELADFFHVPQHIRQEDGSRDVFERIFQAIDRDSSRDISWEEFRAYFGDEANRACQIQQRGHDAGIGMYQEPPRADGFRGLPQEEVVDYSEGIEQQPHQYESVAASQRRSKEEDGIRHRKHHHHPQSAPKHPSDQDYSHLRDSKAEQQSRHYKDAEQIDSERKHQIPYHHHDDQHHLDSMPRHSLRGHHHGDHSHHVESSRLLHSDCHGDDHYHARRDAADKSEASRTVDASEPKVERQLHDHKAGDDIPRSGQRYHNDKLFASPSRKHSGELFSKRAVLEKNLPHFSLSAVGPLAPASLNLASGAISRGRDRAHVQSGAARQQTPARELPHLAVRLGRASLAALLDTARRQFAWADEGVGGRISGVEAIQLCRQLRYARGGAPLPFAEAAPLLPRFACLDDGKLGFEDFCRFHALLELKFGGSTPYSALDGDGTPALISQPAPAMNLPFRPDALTPFGFYARGDFGMSPPKLGHSSRCLQLSKSKLNIPEGFARGELMRLLSLPVTAPVVDGRGTGPFTARRLAELREDNFNFYLLQESCLEQAPNLKRDMSQVWDDQCDLVEWLTRAGIGTPIPAVAWWIARVAGQLLRSVEHLHAHGVLHLGICPANIVLSGTITGAGGLPMEVVLADEGLGGLFAEVSPALVAHMGWHEIMRSRRLASAALGPVVSCAAPETLAGMPCHASDLYSLGCVLHLLLFGQLPPVADASFGVVPGAPLRTISHIDGPNFAWTHAQELVKLSRALRDPSGTCRPTIAAARFTTAKVADSLIGPSGSYLNATKEDPAIIKSLISRWHGFGAKEMNRRNALQRLSTSVHNQSEGRNNACMNAEALSTEAAGLFSAEPVSSEPACEGAVIALLRRALPANIAHSSGVRDSILLAVPSLMPSAPAPDEPDEAVLLQQDGPPTPVELAGSVVLPALQAIIDLQEFVVGAKQARSGLCAFAEALAGEAPVPASPTHASQYATSLPRSKTDGDNNQRTFLNAKLVE